MHRCVCTCTHVGVQPLTHPPTQCYLNTLTFLDQFCHYSVKAAIDNVEINVHAAIIKFYLTETSSGGVLLKPGLDTGVLSDG